MPRLRIIVLDRTAADVYRYALWADVPAVRQTFFANPTLVSAWKNAITADNTNLQSGAMVEEVSELQVPAGSTNVQIQNHLEARWTAYQNRITNWNPWIRYGSTWDGTTWVPGGVA